VRSLTPDEAELWNRVTATIKPLSRVKQQLQAVVKKDQSEPAGPAKPARPRPRRVPALPPVRLGTTLDGSWDKKLRSGSIEPDRILDLHGMNLDAAWRAIDRALEQAVIQRQRVLLLVTGHQRAGEPPVERGKIRAAVHDWLAASRHARDIAGVRGAHRRHGGGGSLYIILRRR
jgi:DNA-nicking Smr family endonuclease